MLQGACVWCVCVCGVCVGGLLRAVRMLVYGMLVHVWTPGEREGVHTRVQCVCMHVCARHASMQRVCMRMCVRAGVS